MKAGEHDQRNRTNEHDIGLTNVENGAASESVNFACPHKPCAVDSVNERRMTRIVLRLTSPLRLICQDE